MLLKGSAVQRAARDAEVFCKVKAPAWRSLNLQGFLAAGACATSVFPLSARGVTAPMGTWGNSQPSPGMLMSPGAWKTNGSLRSSAALQDFSSHQPLHQHRQHLSPSPGEGSVREREPMPKLIMCLINYTSCQTTCPRSPLVKDEPGAPNVVKPPSTHSSSSEPQLGLPFLGCSHLGVGLQLPPPPLLAGTRIQSQIKLSPIQPPCQLLSGESSLLNRGRAERAILMQQSWSAVPGIAGVMRM